MFTSSVTASLICRWREIQLEMGTLISNREQFKVKNTNIFIRKLYDHEPLTSEDTFSNIVRAKLILKQERK